MDEVNKIIFEADTSQPTTSIKEVKSEINALKNDLLNLDRGTAEYNETLRKLALQQKQLNQINLDVRASTQSLSTMLSNVSKIGASVAAGFSAMNATMALMGVENEGLTKSMVKLQAGIALVQSLNGFSGLLKSGPMISGMFKTMSMSVTTTTTAFKGLTTAMKLFVGIPAVAVILALVAGIGFLSKALSSSKKANEELNTSYENFNTTLKETNQLNSNELTMAKEKGATEEQLLEIKKNQTQASIDATKVMLAEFEAMKKLKKQNKENYEATKKQLDDLLAIQKNFGFEKELIDQKNKNKAATTALQEKNDAIKAANERKKELIRIAEEEQKTILSIKQRNKVYSLGDEEGELYLLGIQLKEELALYKKNGEDTSTLLEYYKNKEADILEKYADIRVENNKKAWEKYTEKQKKSFDKLYTETDLGLQRIEVLEGEKLMGIDENNTSQRLEVERSFIDQKYALLQGENEREREEILTQLADSATTTERRMELLNMEVENELIGRQLIIDMNNEVSNSDKKIAENQKSIYNEKLNTIKTFTAAATMVLGENTAAGKAAAVATTTIEMYQTISGIIKSWSPTGPWGYAAGVAQAAIAATSGIKNIKSILAVKVPGPDTSASIPTPNISGFRAPITQTHSVITADEEAILNDPQRNRVYVLESDITQTQNRVKTIESEATF